MQNFQWYHFIFQMLVTVRILSMLYDSQTWSPCTFVANPDPLLRGLPQPTQQRIWICKGNCLTASCRKFCYGQGYVSCKICRSACKCNCLYAVMRYIYVVWMQLRPSRRHTCMPWLVFQIESKICLLHFVYIYLDVTGYSRVIAWAYPICLLFLLLMTISILRYSVLEMCQNCFIKWSISM